MASRINILTTFGVRHELNLINFAELKYEHSNIILGSELSNVSAAEYFPNIENMKSLSRVTIDDIIYKTGTSILTNADTNNLQFGVLQNVYFADNKIYFKYKEYNVVGFDDRFFA